MGHARTAAAATALLVEAGLAVWAVTIHHGFTAVYGNVGDSVWNEFRDQFSYGVSGVALGVVLFAALIAAAVSPTAWMRTAAAVVPPLMLLGMFAVTPMALDARAEEYTATPQCVFSEDRGSGPIFGAARKTQRGLDSIDHVGRFSGAGATGVSGCDRRAILVDGADALTHYRVALPRAGWRVVVDEGSRLRAERDGMAFEVAGCDNEVVVWAGRIGATGSAGC